MMLHTARLSTDVVEPIDEYLLLS